jgi:hypothetical protein
MSPLGRFCASAFDANEVYGKSKEVVAVFKRLHT